MAREYSRICLKSFWSWKTTQKSVFGPQNTCFNVLSLYFGPQCPQIAVPQPKVGPQCPYLAVPPHIRWTSMSISGGPTAYYWTSMPPRTWDPGNTGSQAILRTSHPGCHSIKQENWTAILAVIQSNQ